MEIIDKINYLIKEKSLQKKDFVHKLQLLEPKLKSTGNIPSEQTIYGYLNGKRELKVELTRSHRPRWERIRELLSLTHLILIYTPTQERWERKK